MPVLRLTKGYEAIIDQPTYDVLVFMGWLTGWYALVTRDGRIYAVHDTSKHAPPRRKIYLHRFVSGAEWGDPDIDHKDGNGLHNWPWNLRPVTQTQNNINSVSVWSASGFRGVRLLRSGRFEARIKFNGKRITLGTYATAAEASLVYEAKRIELFGEFAPSRKTA